MHLILGSQSPRRKEILSHFKIPFEQITSSFPEESVLFKGNPASYAIEIAEGKALTLHHRFPDAVILTADTVVYRKGKVYGKPTDELNAASILKELAGDWHSVYTAISLVFGKEHFSSIEETRVLLNPLSDEQIRAYQTSFDCYDKAGAYAVQLPGSCIVNRIEGCFYNAMGLPINTLRTLLLKIGIDLWQYCK